jgi:hypothetical protein
MRDFDDHWALAALWLDDLEHDRPVLTLFSARRQSVLEPSSFLKDLAFEHISYATNIFVSWLSRRVFAENPRAAVG